MSTPYPSTHVLHQQLHSHPKASLQVPHPPPPNRRHRFALSVLALSVAKLPSEMNQPLKFHPPTPSLPPSLPYTVLLTWSRGFFSSNWSQMAMHSSNLLCLNITVPTNRGSSLSMVELEPRVVYNHTPRPHRNPARQ